MLGRRGGPSSTGEHDTVGMRHLACFISQPFCPLSNPQLKMVEELANVRYEDEQHTSSLLRSLVMEEECKSSNCGSMNTNISSTLQQNIGEHLRTRL